MLWFFVQLNQQILGFFFLEQHSPTCNHKHLYPVCFQPSLLCSPAGNKSDLVDQRQVLFEDACTLAEKNGVLAALETSAKEAQNVEMAFNLMARELLARNGMTMVDEASPDHPQFMLSNSSHPVYGNVSSDKKCGCWADWSRNV